MIKFIALLPQKKSGPTDLPARFLFGLKATKLEQNRPANLEDPRC
jgi:hypothetical protein